MSNFETTIQTYLENRAKTDSLFAETYKKANKSIKECCKYIYSRARKLAAGVGGKEIDLCKDLERELEYTKRSKLWMIWSL